jgi:hypothetical protein
VLRLEMGCAQGETRVGDELAEQNNEPENVSLMKENQEKRWDGRRVR